MRNVIGLLGIVSTLMTTIPAIAEVTSDGSTGTIVTPSGAVFNITGGTTVGGRNLFHSFDRFDVPTLGAANFLNDPGIVNIFSRVTGGKVSEIDGVLRSQGSANLFLMNPSGIVFGQNASLNIGGSFVATTANAIQFGDRGTFSASVSSVANVLTVDPSAFLFGQAPGAIVNRSIAAADPFTTSVLGLRVPDEQNLVLLGGNVNIAGGGLNAYGGSVEIGAVGGRGSVGIKSNGRLVVPDNLELADVSFNGGWIDSRYSDRGVISVSARNINLAAGSRIVALNLGSSNSRSGDIALKATDTITLLNSSILNVTSSQGNSGSISINARNSIISRNGVILTTTLNKGNAGNLAVDTNELQVLGGAISSTTFAQGNAGDVSVKTRRITIQNGGYIATTAFDGSTGRGGNLTVTASEQLELIGTINQAGRRFVSGITAETTGTGDAGTLRINTGRLLILDGAAIKTETANSGRGGDLSINASESIDVIGGADRGFASSISSETDGGTGDAGDLFIQTSRLTIQDGAVISSGIRPNTSIPEDELQLNGAGGNLTIIADKIDVFGYRPNLPEVVSSIFSSTQTQNEKPTGNINIKTRQLSVRDGGRITTSTGGSGNAGSLTINASELIEISGISANGRFSSELSTGVIPRAELSATGQGGDLNIETNRLNIREGGLIYTSTFAEGKAGNLNLFASNIVVQGGTLSEFASILGIRGAISAQSLSTGQAGNITINVANQLWLTDSSILTSALGSSGGNIQINTAPEYISGVTFLRNSDISTTSQGDGGNITIGGSGVIIFIDSDILARSQDARGGNIIFNTPGLFIEGGYRPTPAGAETNGNSRVDIDASGQTSGSIIFPDDNLIQNSLAELQQQALDTNTLLTNSCITRNQKNGAFYITGRGGLIPNPSELSNYSTGAIQTTSSSEKRGAAIVEPQAVYPLPDGRLILSRECSYN